LNNPKAYNIFETVSDRGAEKMVVDGRWLCRWGCRFDQLFTFCGGFGFFGLWGFAFLSCVYHGLWLVNRLGTRLGFEVIGVDDDFGKVDDDEVGLWGWFGEVEMKS